MEMPVDMSQAKRIVTQMAAEIERLKADKADAAAWREAVFDACTVAGELGWTADPRQSVERLIAWHVAVALDPAVSKPIADLKAERDLFKHGHRIASDNCVRLEGKLAHWKANHADMVKRAALLAERPDLPVDRIPAYRELVRLQEEAAQRAVEDEDDITSIMLTTRLMVGVANALKGQPKPLHQHSWHDLPKLARRMTRKYAVLMARNRQLREANASLNAQLDRQGDLAALEQFRELLAAGRVRLNFIEDDTLGPTEIVVDLPSGPLSLDAGPFLAETTTKGETHDVIDHP